MATRKIINIDEDKCNGCGECVVGCEEGALQIVDGVAKLVNESFCDGFGDCIGECPTGALTIEERDAKEFDLEATIEHVKEKRGEEAVEGMLKSQKKHMENKTEPKQSFGCPGKRAVFQDKPKDNLKQEDNQQEEVSVQSQLRQWPVQIHLLSPDAAYFENADLLITADCVPVAYGDYHQKMLKDKIVAMGCPKLDQADAYVERLAAIIANNKINSITIARMEVPCCGGMVRIVEEAIKQADSDLEAEVKVISIQGEEK